MFNNEFNLWKYSMFTMLAFAVVAVSPVWANGNDDDDRRHNREYAVGITHVWIKDDSRSFDPRFDWNCSSPGMIAALDSIDNTTCDTDGDGLNDLIAGDRGKRTLALRILYPIERKRARRRAELTRAEQFFEGAVDDCVDLTANALLPFISFGFGFNWTFTTEGPEGDLSTLLFPPDAFITPELQEEGCNIRTQVYADVKPARGKFPVITYSHGDSGGASTPKEVLRLVRSGYIVLEVLHAGDGTTYIPDSALESSRVPDDLAMRVSDTGLYSSQQIAGLGLPDPQREQDIKMRAEDLLALIKFAKQLNYTRRPKSLLEARSKKTLRRLKGKLDLERLGYFGTSNGGVTGLFALQKAEFAELYKAAVIHIATTSGTPLQENVNGAFLETAFSRSDILRPDGYIFNEDAISDSIVQTVPMLTYIGVEDDIVPLREWCLATGFCNPLLSGNGRPQYVPARSNLHPLHVNEVVMGAEGPQYLLNIRDNDHASFTTFDLIDDLPSAAAVLPDSLYKESIWGETGDFQFLGTDPAGHGFARRYAFLDQRTLADISSLYAHTWMDLYLKDRICSNDRDVDIFDDDGNIVVTVPNEWNNLKILKSAFHFDPAGVDSVVYNNLLVGLEEGAEEVVCGDDDDDHGHH